MSELVTHTFEPVYDQSSRVLILGTMPSPASREQGFYYSHPRNRFWPVMAAVLGRAVPSSTEEKRDFCLSCGIALWDVLESCVIEGASDGSIRQPKVNDIPSLLAKTDVGLVCTTGAKASELYSRHFAGLEAEHIALPSTSPANARMNMEQLTTAYSVIAAALNAGSNS